METITITDLKELYERLADAELFFDIENDGKTITIESPVNKYYDPLKKIGYGYYGNFAKYVYHLNENEYLTDIIHSAFLYYQECYNKQIKKKIKELEALKRNEQLTNLEKELNIDLITLFKALKNGIYIKEVNTKVKFIAPNLLVFDDEYLYELKYCRNYTKLSEHNYPLYFKDYGKTWALTEGEFQ